MIDLKKFKIKANRNKPKLSSFLKKFDNTYIPSMYKKAVEIDATVWNEVSCLSCANCCKNMTPTFTHKDMNRIADYLNIDLRQLIDTYFMRDETNGDIVNKTTPCQWLDCNTNMCTIYEVRPDDCAGFPHHTKKRFDLYTHIYEQNLNKCPATYTFVNKVKEWAEANYNL